MTYNEFIKKYDGTALDYDGNGPQCVDLIKFYLKDVFSINPLNIGNAEAYFRRYNEIDYLKQNFNKIVNTPYFIPIKGDICVWGTDLSKYGHVALATGEGTENYFYSYDENWGIKKVHKVFHNYKGFVGVLRPKKQYLLHDNPSVLDYLLEVDQMKTYVNGSTIEPVYADSKCTIKIGELNPRESCNCLGIKDSKAIVFYKVNGTNNHKIGFVSWLGGVK